MALRSQLFRGDPKLEAAAVSDPAHILPGARGPHVGKIQFALIQLDGASISQDSVYGPSTAAAVRAFKQKRQILNFQGRIDDSSARKRSRPSMRRWPKKKIVPGAWAGWALRSGGRRRAG